MPVTATPDTGSFSPFGALLSLLVPSTCAACLTPRRDLFGGGICRRCWESLPSFGGEARCPVCAGPGPSPGLRCRGCLKTPPAFSRAAACGPYVGSMRRLVHAFKFGGWDILAAPAGRRLAEVAGRDGLAEGRDAVVPLVSTRGRNRERGFDPAVLLARETAIRLKLPVRSLLRRVRDTGPQSALPRERREENVAGAFASRPAAGLRLLLMDDVMTTGATASAAARALRHAGAADVRLLVLARTPGPSEADSREAR